MEEVWKTIPSYPNYEVSNDGRVRNKKTGRILKTATSPYGYKQTYLGAGNPVVIHRVVAEAFFGPATGLVVDHINGHRDDNRVENLRYLTHEANIRHIGKRWDPTLETYV